MRIEDEDPERPWSSEGVFRLAPGVYRVPLPMPGEPLVAVNVYAIEDGDRFVMIDSGVSAAESRDLLERGLGALGVGLGDVHRFLVTHVHYDHYSQALALRGEFGAQVGLGAHERPSLKVLMDGADVFESQFRLLRRYAADDVAEEFAAFVEANSTAKHPAIAEYPDVWFDDLATVRVGPRSLQVLHTPGHTRGHVVFTDQANGLLFAGDHVLPRITPSIGFEPAPPELPLADYLRSLRLVRELPDQRLLPAHGPTADSVHQRIDELLDHHDHRLGDIFRAVASGSTTARAIAGRLTWTRRGRHFDELDAFNRMLAVLETGAHLDLLVVRGQLSASTVEGVERYEAA